jgi:hypothetical protein
MGASAIRQVCSPEIRLTKVRPAQVCSAHVCSQSVRVAQICLAQARLAQISSAEPLPTQVRATHIGPQRLRPYLPLTRMHATAARPGCGPA